MPVAYRADYHPSALVAFWEALANDSTTIKRDAVITLPQGLLAKLLELVETEESPHLAILGNPSIGKTYFGYVLLHHLAHQGTTVVYESGAETRQDFDGLLKNTAAYCIVDACKPVDRPAKTILVTSPRRSVWYQFSKKACWIRSMPVWPREEIVTCHQLLCYNFESSRQRAFSQVGWDPAVYYADNESQQQLFEQASPAIYTVDDLLDMCRTVDTDEDPAAHTLLHKCIRDDFLGDDFVFASEYVRDTVYRILFNSDKERAALGTDTKLVMRALQTMVFNDHAKVLSASDDAGVYYRPGVAPFNWSVDALVKPNALFRVADDHKRRPCTREELIDTLKLLGAPDTPKRLYFVIPPETFDTFTYQEVGDVVTCMEANVCKIQQYEMEVPLPTL
uniref:Crinkler effector protein N-terminal domain-containing protein n=1 Tax=Globisporangium ultimum (strain ATCC 200006 / CBS 805.95 / DAOM BR144) TaxID=431595 RepID=K3WQS3_GLOUD